MSNKENKIRTPHITADKGAFAKTILCPGDPQRSELIAKEFLEGAKLVNNIRGVQGYTGTYKGKKLSVMASGMGCPSMGIYSHELYTSCEVDNIIRVGTCGSYHPDLHLSDIVIAQGACTNSAFQDHYLQLGTYSAIGSFDLIRKAAEYCESSNLKYMVGNVITSDVFYSPKQDWTVWQKMGCLAVEMETYALYINAAYLNKKAVAIFGVSDSFVYPEEDMTAEERRDSFENMLTCGLETAYSLS